jgi:hypothetical protein
MKVKLPYRASEAWRDLEDRRLELDKDEIASNPVWISGREIENV